MRAFIMSAVCFGTANRVCTLVCPRVRNAAFPAAATQPYEVVNLRSSQRKLLPYTSCKQLSEAMAAARSGIVVIQSGIADDPVLSLDLQTMTGQMVVSEQVGSRYPYPRNANAPNT